MNILSKSVKSLLLAALMLPLSSMADARFEGFSFDKLSQELCEAVKLESPAQVRRELRKARIHISEIYEHIDCDGLSLLEVAELNQAGRVADYLKRKVAGIESNAKRLAKVQP